ncbi:hypothetical protein L218DRAFT_986456 [Marasmius fiardii PR-910]|nr:hypothetical protein L218DRAFT_986456 [Marasmius fiardii PR-910]
MAEPHTSRSSLRRRRIAQLEWEQQAEDREAFDAITTCDIDIDGVARWHLDGLAFRDATNMTNEQQPITPPLTLKSTKPESYSPHSTVKNLVQSNLEKRMLRNQRSPVKAVFGFHEEPPAKERTETDIDATIRFPSVKRKAHSAFYAPFPHPEEREEEEAESESDIDATIRRPVPKRACRTSLSSLGSGGPAGSGKPSTENRFPRVLENHGRPIPLSQPAPAMFRPRARADTLVSGAGPLTALDRVGGRIKGGEIQRKPTPASGVLMGGKKREY